MIWNRVLTGGSVALAQAKRELLRRHRRESSEDVVLTYSTAVDSVTESFDHDPFGPTASPTSRPWSACAAEMELPRGTRPRAASDDVLERAPRREQTKHDFLFGASSDVSELAWPIYAVVSRQRSTEPLRSPRNRAGLTVPIVLRRFRTLKTRVQNFAPPGRRRWQ